MLYDNLAVNEQGHLTVGGLDTVALAEEFGAPLYVLDEDKLRENCRTYVQALRENMPEGSYPLFAGRALCFKGLYPVLNEEGMGADVVSPGEIYTALAGGFPAEKLYFHGNNKTTEELNMALDYGVGRIVVDNIYEMEHLNQLAAEKHLTAPILLRIKPGVDAHTHNFIRTGQIDSKFGFALETGEAYEAVKKAISYPNLKLRGLHCHIGSQILDTQGFTAAAEVMMEFIEKLKHELHYEAQDLNLGGGFGIRYTEEDDPLPYDAYMEAVAKVINGFCASHDVKRPFILIEPGRSIAAPAGITLYTVGGIKEIPNIRTYVSVDGGMCDNPRYILYQSAYDALVANKAGQPKTEKVTIIAVCATGAYNYSMASNYNRLQKPAVVFVKGGEDRLAVKRESLDDILRNDI